MSSVTLEQKYNEACNTRSDINEHVPVHRELAKQCESVVEIGVRSMVSTWGLLMGLKPGSKYIGVDLNYPPEETFELAKRLAEEKGIIFRFIARDDMKIRPEEIGEVDMMFIDSLHTYCHCTYELETFHHLAKKFLTFHDTSYPWDIRDDMEYHGDYSEYPAHFDKTKRGVWTAVEDFLDRHKDEWMLTNRLTNCHGFTILQPTSNRVKRIGFSFPEEKMVVDIPNIKTRMMSPMIPGDQSTYIYNTEEEYYRQYQESYFAVTCKKRGWDCLRHYEIIANGCIPVFTDIEQCPSNTMFYYPKELQLEANNFYSSYMLHDINDVDFIAKYRELLEKFLLHFKSNLTTIAMTHHLLGDRNPKRILFLSDFPLPDYLRCLTLHGLKKRFGTMCHDFPKVSHLYSDYPGDVSQLYGKGITYAKNLSPSLHIDEDDNFYAVEEKVKRHYYDIIIYGAMDRGMILYNTVVSTYAKEDIYYLNGGDEQLTTRDVPFTNMFVRELV